MTAPGSDSGVDFYLYNRDQEKPLGVAQCKAWSRSPIKVNYVRELYGIMADKEAPLGILVTTGSFTQAARKFASNKRIKLITHEKLLVEILNLTIQQQKTLFDKATWGDYSTPTCPICHVKMTLRATDKSNAGQFWGCSEYPKCVIRLPVSSPITDPKGQQLL